MPDLLEDIDRYVIRSLSRQRTCVDTASFRLLLSPDTDMVYLNYAVPTGGLVDRETIQEMVQAFRDNDRSPRLEFRAETHPTLAPALQEAGFHVEHVQPVMACDASTFRPRHAPGLDLERMGSTSNFRSFLDVANLAFGMDEPLDEARVASTRKSMEEGHWALALARVDRQPAGVGYLGPHEGVAELAGIGTHPDFRRRGVASTVSSALMEDFFGSGGRLVWLSAGDDAAKATYEGLGFRTVGTQMNLFLLPTSGPAGS